MVQELSKKTNQLSPRSKVALSSGKHAVVIDWVDEGTQGDIYRCLYDGELACLKIFKAGGATTSQQRKHLARYAAQGRPSRNFVKVLDIVPSKVGDVPAGYVMEWVETSSLVGINALTQLNPLPPLRLLVDLALILVHSLKALHSRGLAYLDLSDANVRFDFAAGRTLRLIDPDNITPDGMPVGVYGTLGCIAPEIFTKKAPPSVLTDLHSLAVIIFQLLAGGGCHPLYGKKHLRFPVDSEKVRLFMEVHHPVFVYDPSDDSNRPDETHHGRLIYCWHGVPMYFREICTRALTEGLHSPTKRVREIEWVDALLKLRGLIDVCPECQEERFVEPDGSNSGSKSALCRACRKEFSVGPRLTLPGVDLVLTPGATLLASQAGETIRNRSDRTVAAVGTVGTERVALKNVGDKPWEVLVDGEKKIVPPAKAVLVVPGMQITLSDASGVGVVSLSS